MKTLGLLVLVFGYSLVNPMNYSSKRFQSNIAVKIVGSQLPKTKKGGSSMYCASVCLQDSSCVAYEIDTTLTCNFYSNFTSFVYNISFTAYLNSVNRFQPLPGTLATYNAADGLLYMVGLTGASTWQGAYDICKSALGFSIILGKKISQFNWLKAMQNATGYYYVVGLRRNATNTWWDDGTDYYQTEVSQVETPVVDALDGGGNVFILFRSHYNDEFATVYNLIVGNYYPVCTANPFNMPI